MDEEFDNNVCGIVVVLVDIAVGRALFSSFLQ